MRPAPVRTASCLVTGLLAALGWSLPARELPALHGFMRATPALRRLWTQHRQEALGLLAPALRRAAGAAAAPPAAFSLLPLVPFSTQRDQGACGSCWVWAPTGMAEVALNAQYGVADRLSVQYMQANDTDQWVCLGGDLTTFCTWYNGSPSNPHPHTLVPWSNPQASYADAAINQYQFASTVPPGAIGTQPGYAGVTLNHQTVATPDQATAIANIQAALQNQQPVAFSFWTNFLAGNGFDAFWASAQPETSPWQNAYEGATETYPDPHWGGHMVMIVGWDTTGPVPCWILLNQWGTTPQRPDGCFRLPMQMNYNATYTLAENGTRYTEPCYGFETLSLATAGNASPAGPPTAPAGSLASADTALAGQVLTLAPSFTAGSPPFTYQWSVDQGLGPKAVAGGLATLSLPNDVVPAYGVLDSNWAGAMASLTVSNAAGSAILGPFTLGVAGAVQNADSGFEDGPGTTAWTWTGTPAVDPVLGGSPTHGGKDFALLTGEGLPAGNAGTLTSALVTLPAAGTPVFATYYLEMATTETKPLALGTCTLQVVDGQGALLKVLKTHTNMDVDHLTYRPETFDLTALNQGGTKLALQAVWSDPDGATAFRLDDVQILTGVAGTGQPTLTAVVPAKGAPGAAVVLTGSHFTGTTGVLFDRTQAAGFTVNSDTQITATVPWDGATGPITVTGPAGTITSGGAFSVAPSFLSNPKSFAYLLGTTLADLAPTTGAAYTTVQLLGLNFTGATGVAFGGVAATFTVNSNTWITASVPWGAVSGPVTVTTPSGMATTLGAFTVTSATPQLTMTPTSATAGSLLTFTGAGFLTAKTVTFNKVPAAAFTVLGDSSLTAQVPSGLSSGLVTVVTGGGPVSTTVAFMVLPPVITSPPSGTAGAPMTVTGSGFLDATTVTFNGVALPAFSATDNSHLVFTVPYLPASGAFPITVTSPEGASLPVLAAVTVPPVPVASFSPTAGNVGSIVTLTGQYLTGTLGVTVNGVGAPFQIVDDGHLAVTIPATASSGLLAVTTAAGTWTSLAAFHVNIQVVLTVSPDGLLVSGTFPFKALVKGDPTGQLTWTVQEGALGGQVDHQGLYTAPATPGTYHVAATSLVDSTASAVAAVLVHTAAITGSASPTTPPTVADLAALMAAYGTKAGDARYNAFADLNGDGVIDDADLALFLKAF